MNSIHPYAPFIPDGADKLIIGTIPPARFCNKSFPLHMDDVNFYYGSRDNSFWELMGLIFGKKFDRSNTSNAVNQRKEFLRSISAGITDTITECIHVDGSASDNKLLIIEYHCGLSELLDNHQGIKTLIYTSNFVKRQMNEIFHTYHSIDKTNSRKQSIIINNRTYPVHILYSPSPQALRNIGQNGAIKREDQYKEIFMK